MCDTKMVTEISTAQYQTKHNVWSNRNKLTERTPGINIIDPNKVGAVDLLHYY